MDYALEIDRIAERIKKIKAKRVKRSRPSPSAR